MKSCADHEYIVKLRIYGSKSMNRIVKSIIGTIAIVVALWWATNHIDPLFAIIIGGVVLGLWVVRLLNKATQK